MSRDPEHSQPLQRVKPTVSRRTQESTDPLGTAALLTMLASTFLMGLTAGWLLGILPSLR